MNVVIERQYDISKPSNTEIFPNSVVRDQDPRKTLQVVMDVVVTRVVSTAKM